MPRRRSAPCLVLREHQHLSPAVAADQRRRAAARLRSLIHRMDDLHRSLRSARSRRRPRSSPDGRAAKRGERAGCRRRTSRRTADSGALRGSSAITRLMSWMKPMSSMRSASSSTKISTCEQVDVALRVLIEQAAGRRHQDVDAAPQRRRLPVEADAADRPRSETQRQMLAVSRDRGLDLRGELARRREDQPAHRRRRGAPGRDALGRQGAAASAARSRRSCRCRSARRREGRRPASTAGMACAWIGVGME